MYYPPTRHNRGVGRTELMRHNTQLRAEFEWCKKLNSHACQASVDRAWFSITRFYSNGKAKIKGKKGFPKLKKKRSFCRVQNVRMET
jgi:putative transposase